MLSKEEVGKKIKKLRKEQGKSQEDLGKQLNRSHAAISYIESGKTELSYEDLRKIAVFFDMTVSELIEEKPQVAFQENWRVSGLNLSEEERKKMIESIDKFKKFISSSQRNARIAGKDDK